MKLVLAIILLSLNSVAKTTTSPVLTPARTILNGSQDTENLVSNDFVYFGSDEIFVYSPIISGTAQLLKRHSGTSILTGANTYSGGTVITDGTLQVGNGGSTGAISSASIVNDSNLVYSYSTTTGMFLPNTGYSGSGNLTATAGNVNFTGNLNVGGIYTHNGTNVTTNGVSTGSNATSTVTAASASITGAIYYSGINTSTFTLNTSATNGAISFNSVRLGHPGILWSFNNNIFNAGSGNITTSGSSVMSWWTTGANLSFTGQLTGSGNIGTNFTSGTGTLTINNPGTSTYSGVISGVYQLLKTGVGAQTFTGINTYTGTTTINNGSLIIDGTGSLGSGNYAGAITLTSPGKLVKKSTVLQNLTGVISGTGSLEILSPSDDNMHIGGTSNNTYSGGTTFESGIVRINDNATNQPLGTGSIHVIGTTILANGTSGSATAKTIANNFNVDSGFGIRFDSGWNTTTYSGVISGAGGVGTSSSGITILTGANTYTGNTNIFPTAELQFNGVNTGSSEKYIYGTLAGSGTIVGNVNILDYAGSKIRGGTGSGSTATLTITGNLDFASSNTAIDVTTQGFLSTNVSKVVVSGTTNLGGCKVNVLGATAGLSTMNIIQSTGTMSGPLCTLGTNSSGHSVTISQSGNNLRIQTGL